MLLLKKLKQEGFSFNKLPDDIGKSASIVLADTTASDGEASQKIQMLDLVTYKCIRKLYKKEVENTITDIAFKNMPGNDGFNTRVGNRASFASGGPTEIRYQIKNADGAYYTRLGGSEHFNAVPDFGLLYNQDEAEDVKDWLQKRGYTNLTIVPYIPQPEYAYAKGGQPKDDRAEISIIKDEEDGLWYMATVDGFKILHTDGFDTKEQLLDFLKDDENLRVVKVWDKKYTAGGIMSLFNRKKEVAHTVSDKDVNQFYNDLLDEIKKYRKYTTAEQIGLTKDAARKWMAGHKISFDNPKGYVQQKIVFLDHLEEQYEDSFAAGGIIETPQQLGSALKAYFKKKYNIDILTKYIKTVRGLDGSWYEISSFRSGQIIPNEVRQEIIKRFRPDANIINWEDVNYGNIMSQRVSLYGRQWKEFLQAQEGKMAKGGTTISDKQMDMKEFTELIKKIRPFTPVHQLDYLARLYRSEEKDGAIEIAKRLVAAIEKMPTVYETEDQEIDDKIVYLHYFYGGSDWYIIEKDNTTEQYQAFGYAILNGDTIMAEWGYISIEEFRNSKRIELDFYFTPVKFGNLKKKWDQEEEEPEVYERPKPGTFLYGQRLDVPEKHSTELLKILSEKGFSIVKKNGESVDLFKNGHTFFVNDNGGELNLGDIKTREHISDIPYSISIPHDAIRSPKELADDIESDFEEYYNKNSKPVPKYKIGDKVRLKSEYLKKEPVMRHFNEATITELSSYYTPETGYMYDTVISQDKSPRHFYESEIEPIKQSLSTHPPLLTTHYPNAYELNKVIEKLLDSKPNDADFTSDEKSFLKYYSGYGGLEKHGATGKGLLYEYYTPSLIAEKMWGLAYKYGFNGGSVLEPSAGIGEFIKYAPEQHMVVAHEINKYSARICKILYPLTTVSTKYFEEIFIKNNDSIRGKITLLKKYKLIIGNPPYGEFGGKWAGMGEKSYTRAGNYIDYFIFRGLDLLEPGGLLIFIVGAEVASGGTPFLAQQMNKCKEEIQEKSDLLDAYRLPNGVFERTDVLTDIIVLRKK